MEILPSSSILKENLKNTPLKVLEDDYYFMTGDDFSKKYHLSKTVWLPYLRSLGIVSKYEKRISGLPPLTIEQKRLVISGLLGDGGITEDGQYYEFHSERQLQYLQLKHRLLSPYSKRIRKVYGGFKYETMAHPIFKEYRKLFYSEEVKGKLIPLKVISDLWDDSILAYWFFDDGNLDDGTGDLIFANFCPVKKQIEDLVGFLKSVYGWNFSCTKNGIFLPRRFSQEIGKILVRFATPDVYYKIPEKCLAPAMISKVNLNDIYTIKPKFYRSCTDEELKKRMEDTVFEYYRKNGFPFIHITESYSSYLLSRFVDFKPKENNGIIMHNTVGLNLCESFFPNIYECHRKGFKSPLESWEDDDYLRKLVKNRLQYADRLTPSAFRTGIKLTKACVSNFKPSVAKYLYSRYCLNGRVLDYSCGFGSRMLAAMSLGLEYSGFEPCEKTYLNLLAFGEFLKRRIGGFFEIKKTGSEEAPFRENYFGFAFSSPPYFDFEYYSSDIGQSIIKYPDLEEWYEKYWFRTMENCYKALVEDGFFGVSLSSSNIYNLIDQTFLYAKKIGFHFYKDYVVPFKHVLSGGDKFEVVLIFSKQPSNKVPVVTSKKYCNKKLSILMKDDFAEVSGIKRKITTQKEIDLAVLKFKEQAPVKGVSRNFYNDGSLGVMPYVLEYKYGSWNSFVRNCGFVPSYETHTPEKHVIDFFEACLRNQKVLSFYEFEKVTGNPASRLKRLFNAGRPFHHLLGELRSVALCQELWKDFLNKLRT